MINTGDSDNDNNKPIEAVLLLEKSAYRIETNGNDINFINNATNEKIRLLTVQELDNLPDEYFVDIFSSTSTSDEMVNILVTTTDPITNVTKKNTSNYSFLKTFSVSEIVNNKKENSVIVFPNPSKNDINIFIPSDIIENSTNLKFELFDISGKMIRNIEYIKDSKTTFNKGSLLAGEYIYRLINNNSLIKEGKLIFN